MDGLLLATALLILPLAYLAVPPLRSVWLRRKEASRPFTYKLKNLDERDKLVMPSSNETAAAIARFREAVRRSDFSDFLGS